MMRIRFLVSASFALALCAGPPVFAQQATAATLSGRITDPAGGLVRGASVTIRNQDRNQSWQSATDDRGRFQFLYLPVGSYELAISAEGFAPKTLPLTLTVGQAVDLALTLDLAGLATQVEVTGIAPMLETRRTQVAETITPRDVDSLPLNGRNYLDLALLTPGVTRTVQRNTERFAETSAVPGTGISVAGQRNLNNSFIVDGLSANDDAAGLAGTYFAEAVIREFQVVTSGGIAEFGRSSAGVVNIVTQSGGNERHGRAHGFFRDEAFDARNPLATREDPLSQAQFGASYSGALVRDRTFGFANVERTDLARTGIITISPGTVDAVNRRLDSVDYRGPRIATGEFPTGYDTTNVFVRVDDSLRSAHRLTARYSFYDVASENARNVGGLNTVSRGTRLDNQDHTAAVSLLSTRSNTSFNELRGQFTRSRLEAPPNDVLGPAVNIAGTASLGTATFSPTARALDVYEVANSYTLQRDAHLIKLGASFLYERLNIVFPGVLQGVYSFSTLANFLAGTYINYQQAFGEEEQFQDNPNVGLFVQDEWRPRADLTVNAGLRYDLQWLQTLVETDTNNVSPRVGVAYAPGTGRTIVRASGGLYYDRIPLRALSNALQRDGVKYNAALVVFGQPGAPVFPSVMNAFPPGVLTNITSIDPGIQNGVGRQFNLQIERQLAPSVTASVGYLHLTGKRIIMSRNVNVPTLSASQAAALGVPNLGRPDPRFGNNGQFQSLGRSQYDGLTVALNAARSPVGSLRLSYTWSKSLDNAGNAFFSSPQDNFNVEDDFGRSDNDLRHRVVASGAAPPIYGIQLAYVFAYASAPPFNIQTGTDRNNDTNVNDRPPAVGRNTGVGFDSATFDVRISRAFPFAGSQRVEVIVDAFNLFNRSNFLIPNNNFGSGTVPPPSFGRPTAASDARQFQLGIRWSF
jgi:Carboxypeptidase regulatory-like domain